MAQTADHLVKYLGPLIVAVEGKVDRDIIRVCPISRPERGCLTYLKPGLPPNNQLRQRLAGVTLICNEEHATALRGFEDLTLLVCPNPRLAFVRAVNAYFAPTRPPAGVHPTASVSPDSIIAPDASVGAFCVIGPGCRIGARSILHPHVTLYSDVRIGSDVIIHSGTVVGADGFGYERNEDGELEKFPHIGSVVIEDRVEIGSNTSIDRGTLGDTIIREGARIDNQVHISHNVEIGRHAAVIAQTMVGGSVSVGDYSWLAPSSIIINQVRIGHRSTVGLGAVVVKDVGDAETVMGSPAVSAEEFRLIRTALKSLIRPKGSKEN